MTMMRGANSVRKYKIQNYQNGHAYLTSHRVCYVAAEDPRKYSVAIDLKELDRVESQVCMTCMHVQARSLSFQSLTSFRVKGWLPEVLSKAHNIPQTTKEDRQVEERNVQSRCLPTIDPPCDAVTFSPSTNKPPPEPSLFQTNQCHLDLSHMYIL